MIPSRLPVSSRCPVPCRRRSRRGSSGWALLLVFGLLIGSGGPAVAQDDEGPLGDRFELEARVFGASFDNFFQAPPGEPEQDVTSTRVEARLYRLLRKDRPWKLYGQAAYVVYEGALDNANEVGVGFLHDARPHRFDAFFQRQRNRPSFDVGDTFDRADVDRLAVEYSYRLDSDWELTGLGTFEDQTFDLTPSRNNDFSTLGAAVRYRGWGYSFSPELGIALGDRSAVDPNEDHSQTDLWLKLRSAPTRRLYLSLRYRYRTRDYDIGLLDASNFGREDDRRQWTLAANIKTVRRLSVDVYYAYEDAESTKASRNFTTSMLGIGLKAEY
jgi:hypothetical protein